MIIEQIYTGCLAQGAYYIESNGEAAIIDPLREVQPYLDKAAKNDATIKYVFETHFHADFVSGHIDLSEKSGAPIVYGPNANPDFDFISAKDGQEFKLGNITIKVLHTPGHTMESTCYLLIDENGKETALFSGDTLFIGDVGRPDLAQKVVADLTQDKLAALLYDSLRNKIMTLSDDIVIYPAHGAGSACGKKMSKETTDSLGNQKKTNYALRSDMTEDEFVSELLNGLVTPPGYFPKNVVMNLKGYESLDEVLKRAQTPLSVSEFEKIIQQEDVLILDTRNASDFSSAFIKNSLNIGIDGSFAMWVGEMISDINQKIVLVTDPGREEECMIRLSRVGYDHTIGYLKGGIDQWRKEGKPVCEQSRITAEEMQEMMDSIHPLLIDIRKKSEYEAEHVMGSINIPLNQLYWSLDQFPEDKFFIIFCAGGYRSMIAASILRQKGFTNFVDVIGGFKEIGATTIPCSEYVCPSTLL